MIQIKCFKFICIFFRKSIGLYQILKNQLDPFCKKNKLFLLKKIANIFDKLIL